VGGLLTVVLAMLVVPAAVPAFLRHRVERPDTAETAARAGVGTGCWKALGDLRAGGVVAAWQITQPSWSCDCGAGVLTRRSCCGASIVDHPPRPRRRRVDKNGISGTGRIIDGSSSTLAKSSSAGPPLFGP
jgi:hypothetical protein